MMKGKLENKGAPPARESKNSGKTAPPSGGKGGSKGGGKGGKGC